jgi:delta-aminolevulinic acid dehydratase/porphobilinogen synthase
MTAAYPNLRLRRIRSSAWSRALHRETVLTPADLIWPLFVTEGTGVEEPIASLPGVSRWSVDGIAKRANEALDLGVRCIALFPNTQPDRRSDDGAEALKPDNLMCRAIRAIKDACGSDIGVLTDVALDLAEGADSVMVKPGLPYLDIVRRVKERFEVPVFAYQVSGEYAMIEAAAAAGAGDRAALVLETLTAFKRAGCSGVLTYHAAHAARLLNG